LAIDVRGFPQGVGIYPKRRQMRAMWDLIDARDDVHRVAA
jgi:hypothetical protein